MSSHSSDDGIWSAAEESPSSGLEVANGYSSSDDASTDVRLWKPAAAQLVREARMTRTMGGVEAPQAQAPQARAPQARAPRRHERAARRESPARDPPAPRAQSRSRSPQRPRAVEAGIDCKHPATTLPELLERWDRFSWKSDPADCKNVETFALEATTTQPVAREGS